MGKWQKAHDLINVAYDYMHGATPLVKDAAGKLHSNEAVNPISSAIMSPLKAIGLARNGAGVGNALKATYGSLDDGLNYANIAGSAFTAGVAMGVGRGLTHDSAGNPDIAGIPMI